MTAKIYGTNLFLYFMERGLTEYKHHRWQPLLSKREKSVALRKYAIIQGGVLFTPRRATAQFC